MYHFNFTSISVLITLYNKVVGLYCMLTISYNGKHALTINPTGFIILVNFEQKQRKTVYL